MGEGSWFMVGVRFCVGESSYRFDQKVVQTENVSD